MSDLQSQEPSIVINGDIQEEPMDNYEQEFGNEGEDQITDEVKPKKTVTFSGVDDAEAEEERRKKEFEEGGGLPEQPTNPDFSS